MRLTTNQRTLLALLPDPPNDGKLCKGGRLNTAESLVRSGLARRTGIGYFNGGYYVRTAEGKAAIGGAA